MEGQQTVESFIAIGAAILVGVIVYVTIILRNPRKLELRNLRQEIEAFKQRQITKINGNHVEWK